jgi:TonB family protein
MSKKWLIFFFILCLSKSDAQKLVSELETEVIGGKEQLEQVLQTQLYLPKVLLTNGFDTHILVFFDLDSLGHAKNVSFNEAYNNVLRAEFTRLLKFLRFKQTQNIKLPTYPYYLDFHISTDRYSKFIKQKYKHTLKNDVPADSSFSVYTKADISPVYYKNGEEGLSEFILSEIEYPQLAIEKSVEGTVVIEFIVETNGYVSSLSVKKSLGAGCVEEALRLIKITRWKPAVYQNKLVRYKMSYPITFSLRNTGRENSSSSQTIGQ